MRRGLFGGFGPAPSGAAPSGRTDGSGNARRGSLLAAAAAPVLLLAVSGCDEAAPPPPAEAAEAAPAEKDALLECTGSTRTTTLVGGRLEDRQGERHEFTLSIGPDATTLEASEGAPTGAECLPRRSCVPFHADEDRVRWRGVTPQGRANTYWLSNLNRRTGVLTISSRTRGEEVERGETTIGWFDCLEA